MFNGPHQDQPGSDGIVDTNFTIAVNNVDKYPLVKPFSGIGITDVITSRTVIAQGFTLNIDLRILNYGLYDELSTVTAYANTPAIATQAIALACRTSTAIVFTWNTTGWSKGNYTISAYVEPLQDEAETSDNTLGGGWVFVTIPGDVNGDKKVNILDCILIANHFGHAGGDGHAPGSKEWLDCVNCDINSDARTNVLDCIILSNNFNKSWT
jgi:hypothetical protein